MVQFAEITGLLQADKETTANAAALEQVLVEAILQGSKTVYEPASDI